ncbi:hypothetical protein F5B20DRAFT_432656 [Whalleya microplaca]|nr:hypothetical protein F5B20DRAFT_432656 [Whalleya microplaca]
MLVPNPFPSEPPSERLVHQRAPSPGRSRHSHQGPINSPARTRLRARVLKPRSRAAAWQGLAQASAMTFVPSPCFFAIEFAPRALGSYLCARAPAAAAEGRRRRHGEALARAVDGVLRTPRRYVPEPDALVCRSRGWGDGGAVGAAVGDRTARRMGRQGAGEWERTINVGNLAMALAAMVNDLSLDDATVGSLGLTKMSVLSTPTKNPSASCGSP